MVAFNASDQDANYQAPDFSRASKGTDPMDWSGLFKGLATGITGIGNVIDSGIKNSINTKLETAYDKTNNEFGVDSATDMQADPGLARQPTPPEIQRAGDNLKSLTTAYNSGQLKGDYYWMRMQSVVRSLRAQYPGYRDEIDQKVSSLTGGTPANQIRAGLEQEAAREQSKADSADAVRYKLREDAAKLGITPEEILKSNDSQLQVRVWNEQSKKAKVERDTAQYDLELKAEQATKQDGIRTAQSALDNLGDSVLANKFGAVTGGATGSTFGDLLKQAQADGPTPTPEHVQALESAFATLSTQVAAEGQKILSHPRYSNLGPEDRKKLLDGLQDRFAQMKEMITSKEYGLATAAQRNNELITTTEANKFLTRDKVARATAGLRAVGGDAFVQGLITANPQNLKEYYQMLSNALTEQVAGGEMTLKDSTTNLAAALKGETPQVVGKVVKDHLDKVLGALRSDNPELFKQTAAQVYKDPTILAAGFDQKTQLSVLQSLTSGDIAKKALADPQLKPLFEQFVGRAFTALAQPALTSLKEAVENQSATIKFDAASGKFQATGTVRQPDPNNPLNLPGRASTVNPYQVDKYGVLAVKAANDLNELMTTISPIINQTGMPMQQNLERMFLGLGLPREDVDKIFESAAQGKGPEETNKKTSDNVTDNRDRLGIEGGDFNQLATLSMDDEALKKLQKTVSAKWDAGGTRSIEPLSPSVENKITSDVNFRGPTALHTAIRMAEAPGGFNSVWGGQVPGLTDMTIAEVLKKQRQLVAGGRASSAAGAYQYMPGTIRELLKAGVITEDDKFDETTQNKMAQYSMEQAGLTQFLNNEISTNEFQNNLAKIWAGFPTTNGKSYYESRLNHATVSVAFVQRALEALKQGDVQDLTKGVEAVSEPTKPLQMPSNPMEVKPPKLELQPDGLPVGTDFAPGTTGMDQSQAGKTPTPDLIAEYQSTPKKDREIWLQKARTMGWNVEEFYNGTYDNIRSK